MKSLNTWRAMAVCAALGGFVAACPVQARADSAPAPSAASDDKKGGDIIVQPPIIVPDKKKK